MIYVRPLVKTNSKGRDVYFIRIQKCKKDGLSNKRYLVGIDEGAPFGYGSLRNLKKSWISNISQELGIMDYRWLPLKRI